MEINEKSIKAAFAAAKSEETKQVLVALFGKQEHDYRDIKTYEDACEFLGIAPMDPEDAEIMSTDEVAYIKIKTIAKALRGGEEVDLTDLDRYLWYPWFYLWTQEEIDNMSEKQKERITPLCCLLGGHASIGAGAGFGYLNAAVRPAYTDANIGARLCRN